MIPLKNDFCYAILDDRGMANATARGAAGVYLHDTRHLSAFGYDLENLPLLHSTVTNTTLTQYFSRMENHAQTLLVRRRLELTRKGVRDELRFENATDAPLSFRPGFVLDADFDDVFEARGARRLAPKADVVRKEHADQLEFAYEAADGIFCRTRVRFSGSDPREQIVIQARSKHTISVEVEFETTLPAARCATKELAPFAPALADQRHDASTRKVLDQAISDINALLVMTEHGRCISAGIPNFVAPFGRDSLITAWLLLDTDPTLARSVLSYLAAKQGQKLDDFREEEPGKIMHEHRESELSRLGELPFRTYYGSADSTPLFLMLLGDYVTRTGDTELARALEDNWRAAIAWVMSYRDDRGLINFRQRPDNKGLLVQSWKDSNDSMSYADGTLGKGDLAVAEVQGYAFAGYNAAIALSQACGGTQSERDGWEKAAQELAMRFQQLYWMEDEGVYALAVDATDRQLDVVASDNGHLLWSGIVPQDKAERVMARLFASDIWSGYGLRTLASGEKRYNPLSYHNGSVWPHDTAIFAAGLARYGDRSGFRRVRDGLVALAQQSADLRLPELVGGYAIDDEVPPLPYIESCRPQAWSAAAMIYVLGKD